MDNLTIIGTSHISKQSINEIKKAFENKPDIVAIELDHKRLHALFEKEQKIGLSAIGKIGLRGYLFAILGRWAQQQLGKSVGVIPGSDMKTAYLLARKNKAQIYLIDQDIEITLSRFSKALTWKEKGRFVLDIIKSPFTSKKEIEELRFDLTKVPDDKLIEKLLLKVKDRYPNIYKTLVTERNEYMVRQLKQLMYANPDKKIVAVIGAGHKEGMLELLKKPEYSFSITANNKSFS